MQTTIAPQIAHFRKAVIHYHRLSQKADAALKPIGLHLEWALIVLGLDVDVLTPTGSIEYWGTNSTYAIGRLLDLGLIERTQNLSVDRRQYFLTLTAKGAALRPRIEEALANVSED